MEHETRAPDGIVRLARGRSGMRLAVINSLSAYWEALRTEAGGALPLRSDIDPRGIEQALAHTFLLERIAPKLGKLRLAGQHLNQIMGMEVRGMPLSALFAPSAREELGELLAGVLDGPATAELSLRPVRRGTAAGAEARMLLLPLRDRDGRVTQALGGLVCLDTDAPPPQRFEIAGCNLTDCAAGATEADPAEHHGPGGQFAEPASSFDAPPVSRRPRGRPYLRLVKSDD